MRVRKHVSNGQVEFEFGLAMVRRAVLRLNRFAKSVLLDMPGQFAWGDYEQRPASEFMRKQAAKCGGELRTVSYSDWLEFYTPLCSRGQGGEL